MRTSHLSRAGCVGTRLVFLAVLVVASSVLPTPNRVGLATRRHPEGAPVHLSAPAQVRAGVLALRAEVEFADRRSPVNGLHVPASPGPARQPAMTHPDQLASGGHAVAFSPEGVLVASGSHLLRAEFVNAQQVVPLRETPQRSAAVTGAVGREAYTYHHPWPGIDVSYEAAPDGIVESTYLVAPGANAGLVRVRYNVPASLDGGGALHWQFDTGELIESAPRAWQERSGHRVGVDAAFRVLGECEVGLTLGAYDPAVLLVIDPVLRWHTFLGSSSSTDYGRGIAVDRTGKVYVTGRSTATWGSPVNPYTGGVDAFVAALDAATGARLWHTFLGSSTNDYGWGVAVDGTGKVYVTGYSDTTWGIPVNPYSGGEEAFVAALDAATGTRLWHTFLGTPNIDNGYGIAADGTGKVYVTGYSGATWGSPVNPFAGGGDAFVAALDAATGARLWHTFLGSSGHGIAVDGTGRVYVTGASGDTWGGPVNPYAGGQDAFAAALDAATGALLWNTFLGSSWYDDGYGIAADGTGKVYVTGYSGATWGSPVNPYVGLSYDAFATALDAATGTRLWHTFLGSSGDEIGYDVAADGTGKVYVTGYSTGSWGSPINPFAGGGDAFLAAIDTATGVRLWHTFLGSSKIDASYGVAVDGVGELYVTGASDASWGSPVNPQAGGFDAFVARLGANRALLPARDFDGDAKGDVAVYRPSAGTWFSLDSSTSNTTYRYHGWGADAQGDVPAPGDYDGDGVIDPTVYRPATGTWFILKSSSNYVDWTWFGWGTATDMLVPGDYDGDGKTDAAVYCSSTGTWYIRPSSGATSWSVVFGQAGDEPIAGDFDGDGKRDPAVYRAASGTWFWLKSSANFTTYDFHGWGVQAEGDVPAPGDYDGDGKTDLCVFRAGTGSWFILESHAAFTTWSWFGWGTVGDQVVPADYDGDGKTDAAVYRATTGQWFVRPSGGTSPWNVVFGTTGDVPLITIR